MYGQVEIRRMLEELALLLNSIYFLREKQVRAVRAIIKAVEFYSCMSGESYQEFCLELVGKNVAWHSGQIFNLHFSDINIFSCNCLYAKATKSL